MALNVNHTPQAYTPSDNPVTWDFDSDQTAEDNFYFEVTVFINDVAVADHQIFPENGINGKFNASAETSNATLIPTASQNLTDDAADYADVKIRITERFGDPVADGATVTTANVTVWKARLTDEDFETFVAADFINDGATTGQKWLTNYPDSDVQKLFLDEQVRLMAITDSIDLNLTIELFDENDVSIVTASFTYGVLNDISIFNFSPDVIIADTAITTGNFSTAAYYVISEDADLFEDYRFNVADKLDECQYSTHKRLHTLSQWGTIEAYSFNLLSRVTAKVKGSGYQQRWGEWDGSEFVYQTTQGRNIDFAKTVDKNMKVTSDWLTEAVQNWLTENFYGSPAVFIEFDSGDLARRKIVNTAYTQKIQETDMLFLEVVNLMLPTYTGMTV